MALKISGSRGFDRINLYSQLAKKAERAERTGEVKPDEVEISDRGKEIHHAMQALSSVSDVRDDKVEAVRSRIESGTYEVSGKDVARKLFAGAVRRGDLGGLRKGNGEDS
jgi:negative regulator of flagellin synthesis FlgM